MEDLLKKYSTHPQLDPLRVMELIPEDWMISDTLGYGDGVYTFLSSVISHTLDQRRCVKSMWHLSEMDRRNA